MYKFLTTINRKIKIAIMLSVDLFLVVFSLFLAFIFRLNDPWPIESFLQSHDVIYIMIISTITFTFILRLHLKKLSRFDFESSTDLVILVVLVTIVGFSVNMFFKIGAPRTTPLIAGAVMLIFMFSFRSFAFNLLRALQLSNSNRISVAIYGAGVSGSQLAAVLRNSKHYKPVAFIDENQHLQGLNISGMHVYKPNQLKKLVSRHEIQEIILAIPSLNQVSRSKIIKSILNIGCKIKEIPTYEEIIKSKNLVTSLRTIETEDIIGRANIEIKIAALDYANSNILVSGAGGSIGSELCRQILITKPRCLVILDMNEFNLFNIEKKLSLIAKEMEIELIPVLGSVCNKPLLEQIFKVHNIKIVLHSAAYKHVSLVENNIIEAIKNNILGTKIIAEVAAKNATERFTLISSDKAVRPTSVMGMTKRIAELVLQDIQDRELKCTYSMVRFGNVAGSSGSVVTIFKQQIEEGGPVVVTHKDITRYFMSLPEAAQLVLLASSFAEGGEVFVLDMGEPIKIIELAQLMIKLSGYTILDDNNPDGDIEIKIGGLRPGEKLYEELIIGNNINSTHHPSILQSKENKISSKHMKEFFNRIDECIRDQNSKHAKKLLSDLIIYVDEL